jgi:class 3 adenylate cyclase
MSKYPSGTVTLLFTDIEGSTLLLRRLGERYVDALATHHRLLREAFTGASGHEIDTQGDSFFVAFQRARDALAAAADAQRRLAREEWPEGVELRVRMGIHTGEPAIGDEGYLGLDVHRAARICSAAHGGQILISQTTRELCYDVLPADIQLEPLGEHRLKDLPRSENLCQLVVPGLRSAFPPLKDLDRQEAESSPFVGRERELGAKALHAVSAATGRLVGTFGGYGRTRHRGFADFGWEVRGMLPSTPSDLQAGLAALGGDLFTLGRTTADYERYVDSVDRKLLEGRLREYREMAVVSRRAAAEADALGKRLAQFGELVGFRKSIEELAAEVEATIERVRRSAAAMEVDAVRADVEGLRARIQRAERELQMRLDEVRSALGNLGIALKHTRHRGVFRVGSRYVVPVFDEVGIEQRREFSSLAEAYSFRRSVRLIHRQREEEWSEASVASMRQWGAEQGIIRPRRDKH